MLNRLKRHEKFLHRMNETKTVFYVQRRTKKREKIRDQDALLDVLGTNYLHENEKLRDC